MDDLDQRIKDANEEMVTEVSETEETVSSNQPTDLLQNSRKSRREVEPRGSRGARPKMQMDMSAITDTGIQYHYKKTKDDSDYYNSIGNKQYARMLKQQYMEDYFLPAVDAMVKLNGLGAMQSNPEVLRQLDELTLLEGNGGSGYTQAYLANLYVPEGQLERSDKQVEQAVRDIMRLCESDQIRSAVGKANDMKRRIDAGENIATDEDYEIVQRVALYGQ